MARVMTDQEHEELADRLHEHMQQVASGLIPADSPATFLKPEGQAALVNGLPWWFGPDYKPTPEALTSATDPAGEPPNSR